jgi:hypothetical protein
MTPLGFADPSPPSGWVEDFHLQAVVHARHTKSNPAEAGLMVKTAKSQPRVSCSIVGPASWLLVDFYFRL